MPARSRAARSGEPRGDVDQVLAGRTWIRGRLQPVEIGISSAGRIVRVARSIPARRRTDLGEAVLLPSAVDLHVHFRDPGPPGAVDSFSTGTLQALYGGVAVVGDMPNTEPPVRSVEALEEKAARVHGRAACDVVLYALAERAAEVRRVRHTAGALKLYLAPTSGVRDPPSESAWAALFEAARESDLPLSVHAERPEAFRTDAPDARSLAEWDAQRPETAERPAVEAVLAAAGPTRLHFAHVTQIELVRRIRAAGYSCEATPHHLILSTSTPDLGAIGRVNPPLRGPATRAALAEGFRRGEVPILASDHAPHPRDVKDRPVGRSASGVPGVETMLPLFLAEVARGELSLEVVQRAASERPARWFGLPMGRLRPGHRATILAIDFRRRVRLDARRLHAPEAPSPFLGREAVFPYRHYLDGELVVDGGEYVGRTQGRVVRPEYARRVTG